MSNTMRIGQGIDAHRLSEGRKLILGGVEIPFHKGLAGHSDADVLLHSICDAILGALGKGDIGEHFPDDDPEFEDISSVELLKRVKELADKEDFRVVNIDSTIVAQQPKIAPYKSEMLRNIRSVFDYAVQVNIKATTTEQMGFTGRGEGIASFCVVLIERGP